MPQREFSPNPAFASSSAKLALMFFLSFITAAVGGLASAEAGSFYAQLQRPSISPPGWVFGPVWTTLYGLMAVAAWLSWRAAPAYWWEKAGLLHLSHLVFNGAWSWVFFVWNNGVAAFANVIGLGVLVLLTTVQFFKTKSLAGILMLPYLAWVSFASWLTWEVWQANPALLGS